MGLSPGITALWLRGLGLSGRGMITQDKPYTSVTGKSIPSPLQLPIREIVLFTKKPILWSLVKRFDYFFTKRSSTPAGRPTIVPVEYLGVRQRLLISIKF